jgi:hypothetical protein
MPARKSLEREAEARMHCHVRKIKMTWFKLRCRVVALAQHVIPGFILGEVWTLYEAFLSVDGVSTLCVRFKTD